MKVPQPQSVEMPYYSRGSIGGRFRGRGHRLRRPFPYFKCFPTVDEHTHTKNVSIKCLKRLKDEDDLGGCRGRLCLFDRPHQFFVG